MADMKILPFTSFQIKIDAEVRSYSRRKVFQIAEDVPGELFESLLERIRSLGTIPLDYAGGSPYE
ncbi:MAG: hypothetical protein L6427_06330 [Actinomycetia bacterium]|nr:hypothetical protein [Actinomycetes bacterium]